MCGRVVSGTAEGGRGRSTASADRGSPERDSFSPCSLIAGTGYEGHGMGPVVSLLNHADRVAETCYRVNRVKASGVWAS